MVKMANVWDRTAEFLSDNIAVVLPIALLAFFVPASISGNFEMAMKDADRGLVVTLYVVQFAFAILSLWGSLTITALATDSAGASDAGRVGGRRLLAAFLVSLAMLAVACLALLPIPAFLAASGYDMAAIARGGQADLGRGASAFILLYSVVVAVLALWLWARLVVVTPVIVREKRMFGAIPQSWKLTRGFALRIVGVTLLLALVAWVSMLAANLVFGVIFELVTGGAGEGVSLARVLTSIVVAAVQTAFTVLVPAFAAKLYQALTAEAGLREGVILA